MKTEQNLVTDILQHSSTLKSIVEKARILSELNQAIVQKLDPSLKNHCRVTEFRDNILTLTTSSPAWGHKVRFAEMDILSTLRAYPEWSGLKSIKTRVCPPQVNQLDNLNQYSSKNQVQNPNQKLAFHLSKENALLLKSIAKDISSIRLQQALLKLTAHEIKS